VVGQQVVVQLQRVRVLLRVLLLRVLLLRVLLQERVQPQEQEQEQL
jgi:hypothetical protein